MTTLAELRRLEKGIPNRNPAGHKSLERKHIPACTGKKKYHELSHIRADVRTINHRKGGRTVTYYPCSGHYHIGGVDVERNRFEMRKHK